MQMEVFVIGSDYIAMTLILFFVTSILRNSNFLAVLSTFCLGEHFSVQQRTVAFCTISLSSTKKIALSENIIFVIYLLSPPQTVGAETESCP